MRFAPILIGVLLGCAGCSGKQASVVGTWKCVQTGDYYRTSYYTFHADGRYEFKGEAGIRSEKYATRFVDTGQYERTPTTLLFRGGETFQERLSPDGSIMRTDKGRGTAHELPLIRVSDKEMVLGAVEDLGEPQLTYVRQ